MAFSIWLIHNLSLKYSGILSVPVIAYSNIDGHAQISSSPGIVAARCRASGFKLWQYYRLQEKKPKTILFSPENLHLKSGEDFYITSSELNTYFNDIFGDDVQLEAILSQNVTFRFPYENHKKVPVEPVKLLSFKPQYTASKEMKIAPDSVIIYGEPIYLEKIERVYTDAIHLSNLYSEVHGEVKLEPIRGIRFSDTKVDYSIYVTRYVETSAPVKVSMKNVPQDKLISVYPTVAKVSFKCVFPLKYNPADKVNFYIDYSDFVKSVNGRCIPKSDKFPEEILSYTIEPQVFECVESIKK